LACENEESLNFEWDCNNPIGVGIKNNLKIRSNLNILSLLIF